MPHSPAVAVSNISPPANNKDTTCKPVKKRGRPAESLDEFLKALTRASGGCVDPSPRKKGRPTECFNYLYQKTRFCDDVLPAKRGRPRKDLPSASMIRSSGGCFDPSPRKRGRPAERFDHLYEKTRFCGNLQPTKRGRPSKNLSMIAPSSKKSTQMLMKEYPMIDQQNQIANANTFRDHEQFN